MGCKELIEALRQAADQKLEAIWDEAEKEAERIRAETARKIDQIRGTYAERQSLESRQKVSEILADANRKERIAELATQKALSDRLFSLAVTSLKRLREDTYRRTFETLVKELPPFSWHTVRVNPEDSSLAKQFFPDAEIVPDPNISGGIDVMNEGGGTRVVNTFEKRLERAWTDMLPELIKDVYREVTG